MASELTIIGNHNKHDENASLPFYRKNSARENSSINVFRQFTALTLDTVGLCAFNYHIHAQENDSSPYVQAVYAASELVFARIFTPIYTIPWIYSLSPQGRKFRKILKIIHDMPNNVIKKRREEMAQQPQKANEYKDFLSILLNVGSDAEVSLTDKEIRAEVDTFMFEGHDTTAAALTVVKQCIYLYLFYVNTFDICYAHDSG
jgi:cytochrome P450